MHVIHKKRKAKLYLTVLPTQRIMCDLGFYLTPNSSSRYLLNLGKSFRKLQRNHLINHLIHLPSLSITTQYNSDCIQLVFARVLIVVATSLFIKKFACENLWEWRKARTKYVQKTKIWMYPNTYRWEKNERFYAFVNPMCAFAFSKIFLVSFFDFKVLSTLDQNWFFSSKIQTQFKVNKENNLVNKQLNFMGKKPLLCLANKYWEFLDRKIGFCYSVSELHIS